MERLGLYDGREDRDIDLAHSDRSKTPVEPYLSEQWFVKMGDYDDGKPGLAQMAMNVVQNGTVKFFPERYAKTYLDWLGEKRDWCISRRLWWGHRIPIWYAKCDGAALHEAFAGRSDPYGNGLADFFSRNWKKMGGKVEGPFLSDQSQASYDSEAAQIVAGNPAGIAIGDYEDTFGKLAAALIRTGKYNASHVFFSDTLALDSIPKDVDVLMIAHPHLRPTRRNFAGLVRQDLRLAGYLADLVEAVGVGALGRGVLRHAPAHHRRDEARRERGHGARDEGIEAAQRGVAGRGRPAWE